MKQTTFIFILKILSLNFSLVLSQSDGPKCGHIPNLNSNNFVSGPRNNLENNPAGYWPWMASIGNYNTDNKWQHQCGATLISDSHFLTAAHCVKLWMEDELKIRIGDSNHTSDNKNGNFEVISMIDATVHPKYNGVSSYYDVAVLKTKRITLFRADIPVCLPANVSFDINKYDGKASQLIGWGSSSVNGIVASWIRRVNIEVFPQIKCNFTHMNRPWSLIDTIQRQLPDLFPNHLLCAGDVIGTQGSCHGDSGGPLLYHDWETDSWVQFALVQGGIRDCGDKDFPGIYVRLEDPEIFSFIHSILDNTRLSPDNADADDPLTKLLDTLEVRTGFTDDIQANSSRYGDNSGNPGIYNSLLGDLNGKTPSKKSLIKPSFEIQKEPNFGVPAKIVVDSMDMPCSGYFDSGYRCIPYYQCENGEIVVNGAGLFDIHSGLSAVTLDSSKSKCPGDLEVCCLHPDFEKAPAGPVPAPVPIPVSPPLSVPAPVFNKPTAPKQYQPRCGQRHTSGIGVRIQNSKEDSGTQFGEWPNMCAVINRTEDNGNLYVCGCSLISDRVVLTAAHCVNHLNAANITIRAGEWDTQKTIEPQPHQDRYAKHVSIHPGFSLLSPQNDFALIHLAEPFILAPHIDTACLPDNINSEANIVPNSCYATGWGKDRFGKAGEYQVIMKKIQMNIVPHPVCENQLRATRLGQYFNLDSSFTCAVGEPGKDTCTGDGGGPLVCPKANRIGEDDGYVQVGIVSWGIGCGEQIPGVYAKVSRALCFIDWATRCVEGSEVDLYGYRGCEDWAKKEYCILKDKITILLELENNTLHDNFVEQIRRHRDRLEEVLPKYEVAIKGCSSGNKDIECGLANSYGEVDLSPNQRAASEVNTQTQTVLIETAEIVEEETGKEE